MLFCSGQCYVVADNCTIINSLVLKPSICFLSLFDTKLSFLLVRLLGVYPLTPWLHICKNAKTFLDLHHVPYAKSCLEHINHRCTCHVAVRGHPHTGWDLLSYFSIAYLFSVLSACAPFPESLHLGVSTSLTGALPCLKT